MTDTLKLARARVQANLLIMYLFVLVETIEKLWPVLDEW